MPQSTILVQSITSGSNPQIAAEQLAEGYKELEGSMIRCNPFTILESLSNLQIESEELAKGYKELERGQQSTTQGRYTTQPQGQLSAQH